MPAEDREPLLPLPAPPVRGEEPLIPVRMLNEWIYCPRLAYLEWVEGEWAETGDTAEGRRVHARVDRPGGHFPAAEELGEERLATRALTLSSARLGIIAKMDLLEAGDGTVTPVETKKGRRPHVDKGAFEPERVQVCAQGLILEDNGYRVHEGLIWFAASRERVPVVLDEELRARTERAIAEMRLMCATGRRPPPLEMSRKCVRCALAGICLPDETRFFATPGIVPRPLNPAAEAALPVYVQKPGAKLRKNGEQLVIEADGEKTAIPLIDVGELVLFGPVSITTPTLHALMRRQIPVTWASTGGWTLGHTVSTGHRNVLVRSAQYEASFDPHRRLAIARDIVAAKIRNARTMLRRNWKKDAPLPGPPAEADAATADTAPPADAAGLRKDILARLARLAERAGAAADTAALLGLEGEAAALYFRHFEAMIAPARRIFPAFRFDRRSRRPPVDPVNALLSFCYALLTRSWLVALSAIGLDPYRGFYHAERYGRPALALDLMEPFRPILADSVVLTLINNREIGPGDFIRRGAAVAMTESARKRLIAAYERRLEQEVVHPLFGYRITMRRLIAVQARLFARHLEGELPRYPHYLPR
ncbi:MAG: CRISPR-associated endonuclease Cas1 [Alphaproteobacteria bacterium]|nr:MAG: CRISPR-associated endonuclease Cas1 [Alphaproteobacteria bacterium]